VPEGDRESSRRDTRIKAKAFDFILEDLWRLSFEESQGLSLI
jgi:hypothetical protein